MAFPFPPSSLLEMRVVAFSPQQGPGIQVAFHQFGDHGNTGNYL